MLLLEYMLMLEFIWFVILSWIVYTLKYHKGYLEIVGNDQVYGPRVVGVFVKYLFFLDSEVHIPVIVLQ